jgi:SMC interacting uncharacterized protein involved in chromosome segregation
MEDTLALIAFAIGIFGTVFGIYKHFKNPQTELEKNQIKTDKELEDKASLLSQKEVQGKAELLAQQVQWEKEANEKRFCDMHILLKDAMSLAENHVHTVDTKVDKLCENVNNMGIEIAKLATTISERIPRKE